MSHANLSPEINDTLSEEREGLSLSSIENGQTVVVKTRNSTYRIAKDSNGKSTIQGHPKYCPIPTDATISGSTYGGSMLRVGFIGIGMSMEFSTDRYPYIHTSAVQSVAVEE